MNWLKRLIRYIIHWSGALRPTGKPPSGPAEDAVWFLPAAYAPGRDDLHPGYPASLSRSPMPEPWIETTHAEYDALRVRLRDQPNKP